MCGGVFNNQIKKDLVILLRLSVKKIEIDEYLAMSHIVTSKKVVVSWRLARRHTLTTLTTDHTAQRRRCPLDNPPFGLNYAKYSVIFIFFSTDGLGNKPFLIWLLTIPPHLKYVTTVPCNLSLIATVVCDRRSFSNINVPLDSVATHMRCGGIIKKRVAANFLENLTVKKFRISNEN